MKLSRRFPIHPQWLLGARKPSPTIRSLQGTVLDIGCADRWIERYISQGTKYIGLDYPPTGSTLYSAKADVLADAAKLPFTSSSVNAIVCLEVIEHTRDHQAALHEFFRTLKQNGTLVLSVPFMYPIHDAPHDFQRLTEHGLRRDLAAAGFEIVKLEKTGHSIRTSGLLFNLALTGGLCTRGRTVDYAILPLAAILVLLINMVSLALSWILPDWNALGFGYEVEATKP